MAYFHGLLFKPNCHKCPLQNETKVWPDGNLPTDIVIVGKCPGKAELVESKGFVGPSGKLLWLLAEQVGLTREMVWTTNAILCYPKKITLANSATISYDEVTALAIECCKERLLNELAYINPKAVVTLGKEALKALFEMPKPKISSYRGAVMQLDLQQRVNDYYKLGI